MTDQGDCRRLIASLGGLWSFDKLANFRKQPSLVSILTPYDLHLIVTRTRGYAYFLQEWGKQTWDVAETSPITAAHVEAASILAVATLDQSFFLVRFDRLTPSEKRCLRAMAELGPEPHRSGSIAEVLGRRATSLGPTRSQLINKGMVWSPS